MAQSPARSEATRFIDPVVRPVVKATDLGSVQVLKQGNVYLLTDSFGDVHADSRGLGLYDGDTRRLSCSILRINGERPVLLQASAGGNYQGAIQLTNPRLERNVADKMRPEDALASQKLGIARHRVIAGDTLEERVRIVNYAELDEQVEMTLELAADAADIFEVRGWTRVKRGRQLPIATRPDRVTFRYEGLDDRHTATHVAFSEPAAVVEPVDPEIAGSVNAGWVRLTWRWPIAPGAARELRWVAWSVGRAVSGTSAGSDVEADDVLFPPEPPRRDRRGRGLVPRLEPGRVRDPDRQRAASTSPSAARPATCACSSTTGRATPSGISPPGCRGSRRCSGATRSSPRSRRCASGPRWRSRRSRCWHRSRRRTRIPTGTPSPARSSTSCERARWPARASCRSGPTTGRWMRRRCG